MNIDIRVEPIIVIEMGIRQRTEADELGHETGGGHQEFPISLLGINSHLGNFHKLKSKVSQLCPPPSLTQLGFPLGKR